MTEEAFLRYRMALVERMPDSPSKRALILGIQSRMKVLRLLQPAEQEMSSRNHDRESERSPRYSNEHRPTRQRATDQEIQKWISRQHGFVAESAWLLHCKEQSGLIAAGTAPNENPCPPEKVAAIKQAYRRFGVI